ncbi:MAG: hypothetical protein LUG60_00180 [Erysipelotrichaceae bacterium]|nr:hypothetical protein [Erysipelotrichaceae bacterium]
MEPLRNCEVYFRRDYEDTRLFYELDKEINDDVYYYCFNIVVLEKILGVKMGVLEVMDYVMEHDLNCYIETLELQDVFSDMQDEMKKAFYKEEKRLEIKEKDEKSKSKCLVTIMNYMHELYPNDDLAFIDQLSNDQLYRFDFYIKKGYTLSKIISLLEKPD